MSMSSPDRSGYSHVSPSGASWRTVGSVGEEIAEDPTLPCFGKIYDDQVLQLAEERAEDNTPKPVAMSMCVGPAISVVRVAVGIHALMGVSIFCIGYFTVDCGTSLQEFKGFPRFIWFVPAAFMLGHLYCEWYCLRFTILPYMQTVQKLRILIPISFKIWFLAGFALSLKTLVSLTLNSLFAAKWAKCSEERFADPWRETLRNSIFFRSFENVQIGHLVLFFWFVSSFLVVVYPVLVTWPKPGQKSLCRDIGTTPTKGTTHWYITIFYENATTGTLLGTLGDSAGLGTLSFQNPPHAAARAKIAWSQFDKSLDLCVNGCGRPKFRQYPTCCTRCRGPGGPHAKDCCDPKRVKLGELDTYWQHIDSIFPRAFTRIGFRGLLKYTLQVNIQVTMYGIERAVNPKGGVDGLALASIFLCMIGAALYGIHIYDALKVIIGASRNLGEAFLRHQISPDDQEPREDAPRTLRTKLRLFKFRTFMLFLIVILLIFGQVYAAIKFVMLKFFCPGQMWNMPLHWDLRLGCVDVMPKSN